MKLWYLPLESIASRYTEQLCNAWMPEVLDRAFPDTWQAVHPRVGVSNEISVGKVLDAYGRGYFSLHQIAEVLRLAEMGAIADGDTIYLQDFWTPGFEAVPYALQQTGRRARLFSMLHAQSVDEYDFTYPMAPWMRHFELGMDALHEGIFVASTIHKTQLRAAGYRAPIHVVGLPISVAEVDKRFTFQARENAVVYSSRLDDEKNWRWMLDVAVAFLHRNQAWHWYISSSRAQIELPKVETINEASARVGGRIQIRAGLTKDEYYGLLSRCKVQFNSSLQDYVSWTLLEACIAGCDIAYPRFRSFPECVPADRLYQPFDRLDALWCLEHAAGEQRNHADIAMRCDILGRGAIAAVLRGERREQNIWTD